MLEPLQKVKNTQGQISEAENISNTVVSERPLSDFFNILTPGVKVYYTGDKEAQAGLQMIDFSSVPYNAVSLYCRKFPNLSLKEDATEIFKKFSEELLQKLILFKKENYPEDVPILEKALQLKKENTAIDDAKL